VVNYTVPVFLHVSSVVYSNFQGASLYAMRRMRHHHVAVSFVKGDALYFFLFQMPKHVGQA